MSNAANFPISRNGEFIWIIRCVTSVRKKLCDVSKVGSVILLGSVISSSTFLVTGSHTQRKKVETFYYPPLSTAGIFSVRFTESSCSFRGNYRSANEEKVARKRRESAFNEIVRSLVSFSVGCAMTDELIGDIRGVKNGGFDGWDELMYRFTVSRYEKCACNNIYNSFRNWNYSCFLTPDRVIFNPRFVSIW